MKEITIKAYAKINLSIDVLGKRPDGYHEVLMVMQQVDLYDMVKIGWQDTSDNETQDNAQDIELTSNLSYLPNDGRNIAYKAAERMAAEFGGGRKGKIYINIEKKVPLAAGLAGGSADCAAVLHGLNRLWELNLDLSELMKIGYSLGADVAFCLAGQSALNEELELKNNPLAGTCALASGIGEKLELITPLKSWILLCKPAISVSTAQVYGGLDLQGIKERPNADELKAGLKERNHYKISKNMMNVLETYSLKEYPVIVYTKNKIVQEGKAYKVLMSGSGPTVFGLYTNKRKGKSAYSKLKLMNGDTFFVKTL